MTEITYAVFRPDYLQGTASCKNESTANLGKEGKAGLPLSEYQGWKGFWLLIMVRESGGDENSLTLCDCCWQKERDWEGNQSACFIVCLYTLTKHSHLKHT